MTPTTGRGAVLLSGRANQTEAGAGAVLGLTLAALLLFCGLAAAHGAAVIVASRQAATGSDLAALAAAGAQQRGGQPCLAADHIATLNHTRLVSCASSAVGWPGRVRVSVEVKIPTVVGTYSVRRSATAGPVE